MKRVIFHIVVTAAFLLSACRGTTIQSTPTAVSGMDASTSTPYPQHINTPSDVLHGRLSEPSNTPTSQTITPTPTILTPTPTFDARTIVTVTPMPPAKCPITNSISNPDMDFLDLSYEKPENRMNVEENIINFINKYGPEPILKELRYSWKKEGEHFAYKDVTNDGIPDLEIGAISFYIFSCKDGKYESIFEIEPDAYLMPPKIFSIKDNNRNGIPELTMLLGFMSQGGHTYAVYEWDQSTFHNLVQPIYPDYPESGGIWVEATGEIHYEDVNNDFINELILNSGIPVWETYYSGFPWRNKRTIYQWNGQDYAPIHDEFSSPEFRFQAIQDGDLATNQLEYDKALSLYQDVIFSNKLKDYSLDIRKNLQENWASQIGDIKPTPTPYPSDPTEYPKLAAYAYYRVMLLHTLRGYESDAGTVYNTLQQKFGADPNGRPYAEMATAFWDAYQSTHKMYDGCTAAIQYATEHRQILIPLGSDFHGSQSHTYVAADVCPFR
jgi:hypothetical protein